MNDEITDLTVINDPITKALRFKLKIAQTLARELYGENPPPEIVASVINAVSMEGISDQMEMIAEVMEKATADICSAAAVAAGS